jgi:hypothetical protein
MNLDDVVEQPSDLGAVQNSNDREQQMAIGVAKAPLPVQQLITRVDRFKELKNKGENQRLHRALRRKEIRLRTKETPRKKEKVSKRSLRC